MTMTLQRGIEAAKSGNKKIAYESLIAVIKADPKSAAAETAWLWLSTVIDDPAQKKKCLDTVLAMNPENQLAKEALNRLESAQLNATEHKNIELPTVDDIFPAFSVDQSANAAPVESSVAQRPEEQEKIGGRKEPRPKVANTHSGEQANAKRGEDTGRSFTTIFAMVAIVILCLFLFLSSVLSDTSSTTPTREIPATYTPLSTARQSRTITTDQGTFSVPGRGYIDGRDPDANPPLTIMNISVRTSIDGPRPAPLACKLQHGTQVQIDDVRQDPAADEPWYKFRVRSGTCEGWVTWWFVSKNREEPIGDRIYD